MFQVRTDYGEFTTELEKGLSTLDYNRDIPSQVMKLEKEALTKDLFLVISSKLLEINDINSDLLYNV